jgi:hypothetical protein
VVSYLEAALAVGTASHSRYDNELAVKYVELVLSEQSGTRLLIRSGHQDAPQRCKRLHDVLRTE